MDLSMATDSTPGSASVAGGGAGITVACPVCTLYLREGISLQKHLDTHPKEQVIEALIKASGSSGTSSPYAAVTTPMSPQVEPTQASSIVNAPGAAPSMLASNPSLPPTPPQAPTSPYPVGLFECPPVNTMMHHHPPPQFASFSYQQFVNNGTMMIPQYAMAPQNQQMMHMFYNPYGMYHQQQIPTVQMISPMAAAPSMATTAVASVSVATAATTTSTMAAMSAVTSRLKTMGPGQDHVTPRNENSPSAEVASPEKELHSQQEEQQQELTVEPETVIPDMLPPSPRMTEETSEQQLTQDEEEKETAEEMSSPEINTQKQPNFEIHLSDSNLGESVLPDVMLNDVTESFVQGTNEEQVEQCMVENESGSHQTVISVEDDKTVTGLEKDDFHPKKEEQEGEQSEQQGGQDLQETKTQTDDLPRVEEEDDDLEEDEEEDDDDEEEEDEDEQEEEQLDNAETNTKHQGQDTEIEREDKNDEMNYEILVIENNLEHDQALESRSHLYVYNGNHPLSSMSPLRAGHSKEQLLLYPINSSETQALGQNDDQDDSREFVDFMDIEHAKEMEGEIGDTEREGSQTPVSIISDISELKMQDIDDLDKPCSPSSSLSNLDTDGGTQDYGQDYVPDSIASMENDMPMDCSRIQVQDQRCQDEDNKKQGQAMDSSNKHVVALGYPLESTSTAVARNSNKALDNSNCLLNLESIEPSTSSSSSFQLSKPQLQKQPMTELLNISEDAHVGPVNVFELDGLQILVPSTFISDSSQKAVSGTSQQSMASCSSSNSAGVDEDIKSVNMRTDESMPPRGELSEQESNGCTEHSAWQLYMGQQHQESSRVSTSYDLMARESWEESEGSDTEAVAAAAAAVAAAAATATMNTGVGGVPLLDSRSLATHFASSLFLDRDRKSPTRRCFKCSYCGQVFDCPKERRVHITSLHKEAGSSSSCSGHAMASSSGVDQNDVKDIKLLESRASIAFDEMLCSQQQPLLHQLQPPPAPGQGNKMIDDDKMVGEAGLTMMMSMDMHGSGAEEAASGEGDVVCNICNQCFAGDKSLQMHHRRVHEQLELEQQGVGVGVIKQPQPPRVRENAKCQVCHMEFPSVLTFNAHLKIHPLECGQCGKYFYRKQNFKLHMKRHLGIKPFPCTICDKAFLTKQKLDEHTNGHTGNAPVKCNFCSETFRRYSNLTQHKNRHHLNIKKKLKDYICQCGEVFHTKKKLAWHKETHDEKPKACSYCNERFIHMASLTRHMRRAHNRRFVPDAQRESENVECPICKCIYLRSSLAVHMRVHNGERPYECQVCSKTFSTKWNLQLHRWTHAARSAKPYKCTQCSAAFYRQSDYTAHTNSHRNVRPYTCNYCGAQFIRKYNCLRHVKEHEEVKAYTCDICNKTFHRSYYLKEHLRVHSGARPYTCHICGKSSSTKSNHNKHVRIHHAREPVNTEN